MMATEKPTAIMGQVMRPNASQNAKKDPFESSPARRSFAPYQKNASRPSDAAAPMDGPMRPRSRARAEARLEIRLVRLVESAALTALEREAPHDAHAR
jgi:hypothetical protein